jgi:hypothetical protein
MANKEKKCQIRGGEKVNKGQKFEASRSKGNTVSTKKMKSSESQGWHKQGGEREVWHKEQENMRERARLSQFTTRSIPRTLSV